MTYYPNRRTSFRSVTSHKHDYPQWMHQDRLQPMKTAPQVQHQFAGPFQSLTDNRYSYTKIPDETYKSSRGINFPSFHCVSKSGSLSKYTTTNLDFQDWKDYNRRPVQKKEKVKEILPEDRDFGTTTRSTYRHPRAKFHKQH